MPKIVDRDAYRQELAAKAVDIFTEHGFNGLGMRGIAEALGVSKSALYHYFPSKEDLFSACTELVLQPHNLYGIPEGSPIPQNREQALFNLIAALDARFKGEMVILLDYVKNRESHDVANDMLLRMADRKILDELSKIVGEANANQAYALLFGGLMIRLLNGKQTDLEEIASWIGNLSPTQA
ncbi:TetR family transcriptional regulator [Photobacterium aquae]|uniref:TetR family transcriptional regulator n=1 Tax=Photobacterium aquae TaxID=1195763 RepID=A0A0J1GY68_9GAMM|nr:TetR/AcrR family transcriptional regulator [Photobacterium aquae]KLV04606.1 TetR family transcriptional regulator [Photobacterium aquae]